MKTSFFMNVGYLIYQFTKYYIASGFKYYRIGKLANTRSSDVFVIMGSGDSINELKEPQYRELENYDVAGLSYSCFLPIKHKYYFYESGRMHEVDINTEHVKNVLPVVRDNMSKGNIEYLLWKNAENRFFSRIYDMNGFLTPTVLTLLTDDPDLIKKILRSYRRFKLNQLFLLQKRGSVSALIEFSVLLGYKKVLLLGVDLNDTKYFFEGQTIYSKHELKSPSQMRCPPERGSHWTNSSTEGMPIEDYIQILSEIHEESEFYVGSVRSKLSNHFRTWKWND